MIVRFGQWAYSALITIGLGETAVFVFFKSDSVLDLITSATAVAETIGAPYSSESSSYQISNQIHQINKSSFKITQTQN